MTRTRSISSFRAVVFTLLLPTLVLGAAELSLRIGGGLFARWATPASQDVQTEGALEIWAVGDSYTVGIGADVPASDSYPAVAARRLEERIGRPVVVRNFARPGNNSSQVVASLERELAERNPPDLVFLLAGINNVRWLGHSGQFCLDEAPKTETPAEWTQWIRSVRLYQLLEQVVVRIQAPAPPVPSVLSCTLVADGFHHLDKGSLMMAGEAFDAALSFNPESRWATLGQALRFQRLGRPELAVAGFRRAQELGLNPPPLVVALRAAQRAAGIEQEQHDSLEGGNRSPLQDFSVFLDAWGQLDSGEVEVSLRLFEDLAETTGARWKVLRGTIVPFAHDGRGWALRRAGRLTESTEAFEQANELGRDMFIVPHLLGWSHLGLALNALDSGEHSRALEELTLAGRDRSATAVSWAVEGWLRAGPTGEGCAAATQLFKDALAASPLQPQALEGQRRCLDLGPRGRLPVMTAPGVVLAPRTLQVPTLQDWIEPNDTRLLAADIARAHELTARAGAQLVLLGYPEPDAHKQLWNGVLRAGQEAQVLIVDSTLPMKRALDAGLPWTQLRIADGHPTTWGYRLMGEWLADELLLFSPDLLEER